jgi:phosphate-selective porin
MKMIRRITLLVAAALLALAMSAPVAFAAQEPPPGCMKDKGTWTCTTTDKPGNSDENGKGNQPEAVVIDETQGNLTNKSPEESQDLADNECTQGSPGLCKQAERQ